MEPIRAKFRKDMEDPRFVIPITESLANCAAVTTDNVEPQITGAKMDKVEPMREKPRNDTLEPR